MRISTAILQAFYKPILKFSGIHGIGEIETFRKSMAGFPVVWRLGGERSEPSIKYSPKITVAPLGDPGRMQKAPISHILTGLR